MATSEKVFCENCDYYKSEEYEEECWSSNNVVLQITPIRKYRDSLMSPSNKNKDNTCSDYKRSKGLAGILKRWWR